MSLAPDNMILDRRIFDATGTDFERGFAQGKHFTNIVPALLAGIRAIPILPCSVQQFIPLSGYKWAITKMGRQFWDTHEHLLRTYARSNLIERIEGIAAGFGTSRDFAYGMSALEAILSEMPHQPQLGCTSIALDSTHTLESTPLIAYNHDFPVSFGPHLYVRRSQPLNRYSSLAITYPILAGCIGGINDAGLAITINHAFERKINKQIPALFVTWLLQECLDHCQSTKEAVALILETPVTNGSMITMMDKSGQSAVVEVSSVKRVVRHTKPDQCVTFNKYHVHELEELEIPITAKGAKMLRGELVHGANLARQKYFDQTFKPEHHYSDDDLHRFLSHHNHGQGTINTICRHCNKSATTLASAIFKPAKKELKVIFGHPCTGLYQTYRL